MKIGWMVMVMMGGVAAGTAQAEELVIESVESAGKLVFNEVSNAVNYRVDWAPSSGGPWTNTWEALNDILPTGSGSITCSVAMCYRVIGTLPPQGMVLIPAGTNSGTDPDFGAYALTVDVAFYMDATEVTKALWDTVYTWAITNGYSFSNTGLGKGTDHPVHTVNWYDCVKWCNARSEKDEKTPVYTVSGSTYKTGESSPDCNFGANGFRLPTNTEWEYAARGGLSGKRFPWGDTITHSQANYYSRSSYSYDTSLTREFHPTYATGATPYTSSVGAFSANGYGLYDMAGNVMEWCWDASGSDRYFRGGSWGTSASLARCGRAYWYPPSGAYYYYGFRAVCR